MQFFLGQKGDLIMGRGRHSWHSPDEWTIALVLASVVLLVAVILWLVHRRTILSNGLTPVERKELPWPQREVLSMLRQNGGPMLQSEIVDRLPGDVQDLAAVMRRMEDNELIARQWIPDKNTYVVTLRGSQAPA
jgi:hypothetical protein